MAALGHVLADLDAAHADVAPAGSLDTALDASRSLLDTMSPAEVVAAAASLLDWEGALAGVGPRRERCRLISYAAIMHGATLLPLLPPLLRTLVPCFDEEEPLVAEELLRTVGNLARYALVAPLPGPLPADVLITLVRPLLAGAADACAPSVRRCACCRATARVLMEAPREQLQLPAAALPVLHGVLKMLAAHPEGEPRDPFLTRDALLPVGRLLQLLGAGLPEVDAHFVTQCALGWGWG